MLRASPLAGEFIEALRTFYRRSIRSLRPHRADSRPVQRQPRARSRACRGRRRRACRLVLGPRLRRHAAAQPSGASGDDLASGASHRRQSRGSRAAHPARSGKAGGGSKRRRHRSPLGNIASRCTNPWKRRERPTRKIKRAHFYAMFRDLVEELFDESEGERISREVEPFGGRLIPCPAWPRCTRARSRGPSEILRSRPTVHEDRVRCHCAKS